MVPFEIRCLGFLDLNFVVVCTEMMISEFLFRSAKCVLNYKGLY